MREIDPDDFPEFDGRTPDEIDESSVIADFNRVFSDSLADGISVDCSGCGTEISIEYQGPIERRIDAISNELTVGQKLLVLLKNTPVSTKGAIKQLLVDLFSVGSDPGRLKVTNGTLVNEANSQIKCESCGKMYDHEDMFDRWIDEGIPTISKREAEEYFEDL